MTLPPRRGAALVVTLATLSALLVVAGVLLASGLRARRAGRAAWIGVQMDAARDAAFAHAHTRVATDAWPRILALRPQETDTLSLPAPAGGTGAAAASATVARADAWQLRLRVEVRDRLARAGRRWPVTRAATYGVQLDVPPLPTLAALQSAGAIRLGALATIDATGTAAPGWEDECALDAAPPPTLPPLQWPAAVAAPARTIDAAAVLVAPAGVPVERGVADTAAWRTVADAAWLAIAARATHVTSDTVVDLDALDGAGCPALGGLARRGAGAPAACTRRWPVVRLDAPTVRLAGSRPVQGILLARGDLRLDAGAGWQGIVLVRGRLRADALPTGAAPPSLRGLVLVLDGSADAVRLERAHVALDRCVARRALAAAGTPRLADGPLPGP